MQKLCRRRQRRHPGRTNLNSYLSARSVVDAHLINGENGAQVGVCSSSFLISSVSSFQFSRPTTVILFGGELDCAGSGEPILFPCVCVRLHVCVCAGERGRDCVCVETGRARGGRLVCAAALPSNLCPMLPGYRSGSDPSAAPRLADFHINPHWSALGHVFSISPAPPSLSSLSLLIYLSPLPISFLVNTWLCKIEIREG